MRYEEIVEMVREATKKAVVSKTLEHIAYQFNVEGEGEGAFYLEIVDGRINVEPYEYYDRDMIIFTSADVLSQMSAGTLQPMAAYTSGMIRVWGDVKNLQLLPLGGRKVCDKS